MDITLTISIIVAMTLSVFVIFKCAKKFKGSTSSSNSSKNESNGNCAGSKKSSTASSTGSTNTSPNTVLSTQRTRSGRHVVHKRFSDDEVLYWYNRYLHSGPEKFKNPGQKNSWNQILNEFHNFYLHIFHKNYYL